ncbi:MAG: hypothetical protein GTN64_07445 [Candidatus Latescibacteria bacterium]|nr:hypothetical protein [Candidatus Latescibacterota bacterium]NIO78437.1 hypothetical protein [Candidatus Latescibacterota bacterium]
MFKCPNKECPNPTHGFRILGAMEMHDTIDVDMEGNCLDSSGGSIEWKPSDTMKCWECSHEGTVEAFDNSEE